jgi:hypothetical protein
MWFYCLTLCFSIFLLPIPLSGDDCQDATWRCPGRVDLGPAYASIDMLESGHTVRTLNLYGGKIDATLPLYKSLCIKPSYLFANGKANLNSWSLGVAVCIPFLSKFYFTPSLGYTETHFKSRLNLRGYGLFHLREKFKSEGLYLGADLCWCITDTWRTYFQYNFAWSYVKTTIRPVSKTRDHTQGPSYALALEKDLASWCSICIAGGYNISLSKEKHGLRGKGAKLGLVFWY